MNKNVVAHLQSLPTIKDFDLAVGGSPTEVNRVSSITTNVTESEVNLIIWLLLEKEFGANGTSFGDEPTSSTGTPAQVSRQASTDSTDARIQADGHRFQRTLSKRERALRYAENLLAAVGVNIPFERLTSEQRHDLFKLFCSSSNLLIQEKFSSILDLYNALRRRSKFREEFNLVCHLGSGKFGKVYSVKKKSDGFRNTLALKKVILTLDLIDLLPMILNESSILKAVVGNEHVVKYHDSWLAMELAENDEFYEADFQEQSLFRDSGMSGTTGTSVASVSDCTTTPVEFDEGSYVFYLLMEQCWISLKQWRVKFPEEDLTAAQLHEIAHGLVDGIDWIHNKGYLHLDINPKNILWKNESRSSVVISDFGLAVPGPTFGERVGTTPYCAPEKILTAKSDIYSLGLTLFEISQRFTTMSEFIHRLDAGDLATGNELLDEMLPTMLHHRPQQRLSAFELKTKYFEDSK